jgi:hypothetical protein
VTDTANITAAVGSGLSAVFLLPGYYYVLAGQVILGEFQYLRGPGKGCCFIAGISGSGPVVQVGNSTGSYHPDEFAGISGVSLDASALGAGCPALQVGDIPNLKIGDIVTRGNASSPGFLARNSSYWTEQMHGSVFARGGGGSAPLVQFDVAGGTNSFDRINMDIWLQPDNASNGGTTPGVAFTNGAVVHWGRLALRGNFIETATGFAPAVLSFSGSTSSGPAGIYRAQLDIQVECDGNKVAGTGPRTVSFNDGAGNAGFIEDCYGLIDFHAYDGASWENSDNSGNNISFNGPVYGDETLIKSAATQDYGRIVSGFPAGWSGVIIWRKLADIDLIHVAWSMVITAGTAMTNGTKLGTLPAPYFFPGDKEMLAGTLFGGETGLAAAQLLGTGEFDYFGPTAKPTATTYWKGQAVLSNAIQ